MGCIYAHILRVETSKQNGWMYIGQAEDLKKRWYQKENAYRDCQFIYRELQKYGWDAFDHIILEDNIPTEKLDERETYWIKKYHTYQHDPEYTGGFNLTPGGDGVRGPHMSMRGVVPKNIPMLTEMKHKEIKCLNSGEFNGAIYSKSQSWPSIKECGAYFEKDPRWVQHRLYGEWQIISGPIFAFANIDTEITEFDIERRKQEIKNKQRENGRALGDSHKTGPRIDYAILCEETGQVFNLVSDCLKAFNMARATLNGHLVHPEKHPTAKGLHFKRIPKTNTAS